MRGPLAQLLATTTCHGVPDWYGAKSLPSKIFWGLVLIAAFGAIGYYQYNLVVTFASVPTATKISKVIVNYVAFPNVTVCNQNSFSMRRLNNKFAEIQPAFLKFINQTSTSIELLQWLRYGTITSVTEFSAYAYRELPEKEYQILFNKSIDTSPFPKYDFTQFMMDIGYSCSDIFTESLDCIYGRAAFNCCANSQPILTQFGNCYKVGPRRMEGSLIPYLAQVQPGNNAGLEIIMTYNSSDSPSFNPLTLRKEGFYISIGDQMSLLDNGAITVGPTMAVSVNLALSRYVYDPAIAACTQTSVPLQYSKPGVTSVLLCKQECQVKLNLKFCGCSPIYPNVILPSDQICPPLKAAQCFFGSSSVAFNSSYRSQVQICQIQQCPKLCNTLVYVPFAVYSSIAPKYRTNSLLESSVATIYFGDLAYTLIEEKPLMDLTTLISAFGGNLGLFAGMSLITVVQCIAAFTCACHERYRLKPKMTRRGDRNFISSNDHFQTDIYYQSQVLPYAGKPIQSSY